MKKFLFLGLLAAFTTLHACKDDDSSTTDEFKYTATIESPDDSDKALGATLPIHVHFKEENGGTIHNINVRIYNKDTNTEIYSKPDNSHSHSSAEKHFEDEIELTEAGHWVLEAKVWGHEDGEAEVKAAVEFHVK